MYRREFLKRAAAALAALAVLSPRRLKDHHHISFLIPDSLDRRKLRWEFHDPAMLAMEHAGAFHRQDRERIFAAMREAPAGTLWLNRRVMARWGGHYDALKAGEIFTIEALHYT